MAIDVLGVATSLASQARALPAPGEGRTQQAAASFESYMLETMIKEMRKTIPEGLFQSTGVEMFSGLFDQAIAQQIAAAGGLGLARSMAPGEDGIAGGMACVGPEPGSAHGITPKAPFAGCDLPVEGHISSPFGYRNDPFDGGRRFHRGLDLAAPVGTPIHSLSDGVVTMAQERKGYGRVVVVEHADGWSSLYAHCDALQVVPGQPVAAGEVLGTVGSSGRSTGPHLHLELHQQGRAVDPAVGLGW